jgi:ribosomal protein S18 acetylase RimI-like enzyme
MERAELLAAGDRNLADVFRLMARTTPGAVLEDDGGVVLFSMLPTWPGPYTNGALRLQRSIAPEDVLARAAGFFDGRSFGYCVWIAAHADAALESAAVAAGLASISATGSPRLVVQQPLGPAEPPAGVTLVEVADDAGRLDYLAVTLAAYGPDLIPVEVAQAQLSSLDALAGPSVRAVVAYGQDGPAAAAMVVSGGGVASVQLVGTVPATRRRGLGELCTRWAVAAGFEGGAGAVVLEASEMGDPVYRAMGFVEVSRYRWCLGPPPWPGRRR